jgi:hypothetical protein
VDWNLAHAPAWLQPRAIRDADQRNCGRLSGELGILWTGIIIGDTGGTSFPKLAFVTTFNGGRPRTHEVELVTVES